MNPLGASITTLLVLATLCLPRRLAALAVVAAICYVTQGQQVDVAGFHFTAIRMVLLAGLIRGLARKEFRGIEVNRIDISLVAYAVVLTVMATMRVGTSAELVYRLGCAYDILLSYWVFRPLLSRPDEVERFLRGLAYLILPLGLLMVWESATGNDIFRYFGGISYDADIVRGGHFRCMGSFRGPITAGVFGATLLPLFVSLWSAAGWRGTAVVGMVGATLITYTSNSSGPLMAFLSGLTALAFWPLRQRMKLVRWGIVVSLLCLHVTMKAPVWYLLSKLSDVTGGDGWHRSYLIDRAIHYFPDWWLVGTSDTSEWMPYAITAANGEQFADMTDLYVAVSVSGGLTALVVLVVLLVNCFRGLGISMALVRHHAAAGDYEAEVWSRGKEGLLWGMGSGLFAHVMTFFSVVYFDQMSVAWYMLVAMISGTTGDLFAMSRVSSPETSDEPVGVYQGDGEVGLPL